jgi:hypothetical protein
MNSHELHLPTWAIYPSFDGIHTSGYPKRAAALEIQYERNIKRNKFTKLDIYSNSLRNLCTATDWTKRWQKKHAKRQRTTWYLIPHTKWVITLLISEMSRVNPLK